MGRLVVAIAGGIIGSFFGMPQLGFMIGSLVGQLLFPQTGPNVEGPRLADSNVTSSAYGTGITKVWGTARVGGNIIWSLPIREQKHVQRQGKGGGGATSTTYTYYWTGAVALCEGPVSAILRVWADGKVVWSRSGDGVNKISDKDFTVRFYPGDEEQLPDGLITADRGVGKVSGHRGLCYIVFDDIPIEDYGNRIPNWTFEVVCSNDPPGENVVKKSDDVWDALGWSNAQDDNWLIDWDRKRLVGITSTGTYRGWRVYDVDSMTEVRTHINEDGLTLKGQLPVSGAWVANVGVGNTRPIVMYQNESLIEIARFGTPGISLSNTTTSFVALSGVYVSSDEAGFEYLLCVGQLGTFGVLDAGLNYVAGAGWGVDESRARGCKGADGAACQGWVVGTSSNEITNTSYGVYRVSLRLGTYLSMPKITPAMVDSGITHLRGLNGPFYSQADNTLCMIISGGTNSTTTGIYFVKYNCADGTVMLSRKLGSYLSSPGSNGLTNHTVLRDSRMVVNVSSSMLRIDTNTGDFTVEDWSAPWAAAPALGAVSGNLQYHSTFDAIMTCHANLNAPRFALNLMGRNAARQSSLQTIISDIVEEVGLDPIADLDLTALSGDYVDGYMIADQASARAGIEPLCTAYQFSMVETDYKLKAVKRGGSSVVTIPEANLVPLDDSGRVINEVHGQEQELPMRLNVNFLDPAKDYQQQTQSDKRVINPVNTMNARNELTTILPIVMSATQGKQLSQTLLYTAWVERDSTEFNLPWTYIRLDPTDVVTINMNDGTVYSQRLNDVDVGADLSMEMKAISEDDTTYVSTATGDGGEGLPDNGVVVPVATQFFMFDIPNLQDQDDPGQTSSRLYVAAGGYGADGWRSAGVYKSFDQTDYAQFAVLTAEVAWGTVTTLVPDTEFPHSTDEELAINVLMVAGDTALQSITQLAMVNGGNPAIIYNPMSKQAEIIQYRSVTQETDGSFTLRGILRGRRGTDAFTGIHAVGDYFIIPSSATFEGPLVGLSEVDMDVFYRGVPRYLPLERGATMVHRHNANPLRPWAPWNHKAVIAASDINLSWQRRTRLNGPLRDGTGTVFNAESIEAYEVDIYNGSSVVRTLTGISTDSVLYTAADIATDFGGMPSTLKFAVYQMSAAVGRGFGKAKTVDVVT